MDTGVTVDRHLSFLRARLDLLHRVLEQIRDQWSDRDIQDLRDQVEQQWIGAATLPIWPCLYQARLAVAGSDEVNRLLVQAVDAVINLREYGDGELPGEVVGDWSSFVKDYRRACALPSVVE